MKKTGELIYAMTQYDPDPGRLEHFLKVYGYAKAIAELEGVDSRTQEIIEAAAIVHDIGIKPSLEKYGSGAGPYQEQEGPSVAWEMLETLGYDQALIERVAYLVGRHHTYTDIDGMDCRILIEADFLVNLRGGEHSAESFAKARETIYRTKTGLHFLDCIQGG